MARDFAWRDLLRLPQYRDQKLYFDNTLDLTYHPGLFSSAVLSLLSPSTGFFTGIQPAGPSDGFLIGQIHKPPGKPSAQISFLAPRDRMKHPKMGSLVQYLCQAAGYQGALQVLAEVDQGSSAEHVMYGVGFRPYADQEIWLLPADFTRDRAYPAWIPITGKHQGAVHSLYQRVIPSGVKHVETAPDAGDLQGLIAWEAGRPAGYVQARIGPSAVLVDAVIDPALGDLPGHVQGIRENLPYHRSRRVYFRVRGYQRKLASALEAVGASLEKNQIAVVKKLAVHQNAQHKVSYRSFENQPDVTTPVSQAKLDR